MFVLPLKHRIGTGLLVIATIALVGWKKLKEPNHQSKFEGTAPLEATTPADGSFRMVRVIDGDTIVVRDKTGEIHVRLIGIDAPEKNQPYGSQATALVTTLIGNQPIKLSGNSKDRYGRLLSHVHAGNTWVNMEMVKQGAAWVYKAKPDTFWADLNDAERDARNNRRGLWADPSPIYPGDWRKR